MRRVMFTRDKEFLFKLIKNDELAVSIVDKIYLMEEGTFHKKVKNLIARKDDQVSSAEISYLNDILSDIKHYEEYPVIKRIESHVYYRENNELMKTEIDKTAIGEPSKVACYYIYQIRVSIFDVKHDGFLCTLVRYLIDREVK